MVQLQKDAEEIAKAGLQIVAISYDSEKILKRFAEEKKISFTLLSDPGSKTIKAYGIYNKKMDGSRVEGIPHPGTFVIDREGVVRAKIFLDGYRSRHSKKDLIDAARDVK